MNFEWSYSFIFFSSTLKAKEITLLMATMNCMVVPGPGQPFKAEKRPIPTPGAKQVLIKVQACGICHSDCFVTEGTWPGIKYPRVPGHEVVGIVSKRGPGVSDTFKEGTVVGVGWHGGHCGTCVPCRKGDFVGCDLGTHINSSPLASGWSI